MTDRPLASLRGRIVDDVLGHAIESTGQARKLQLSRGREISLVWQTLLCFYNPHSIDRIKIKIIYSDFILVGSLFRRPARSQWNKVNPRVTVLSPACDWPIARDKQLS